MSAVKLVEGKVHGDSRGALISYNELSLDAVKRIYAIENTDPSIIRAWQGHKKEEKWFYVCSGSFKFVVARLDNFDDPSEELPLEEFVISVKDYKVLYVPGGYINGFKSLQNESRVLVFSSFTLDESNADDYRFESKRWYTQWDAGIAPNKF